ncbi:exodeoxyribonuclease III [Candidatus Phycorickettsia trachydisci]|uniref:Exodeoxyribonuclease III n=1 Tax=Candidatus Phycorickettsia trachydisci TaxID=2115978 RepID=A0A2P1P8Z6_9RICK|nr:exodeoxyribonuclease III [Candidatus Phycorickettsia trachydisci]AVP87748.1 exodeoxyribonuclease III [Candidatus Phycorickettsia trachydisci]
MQVVNIATWNVNSINVRLEQVQKWLELNKADLLLLQETKSQDSNFPYDSFSNVLHVGQKAYNGVAIISSGDIREITRDFPDNPVPDEARFLHVRAQTHVGPIEAINVYVPNGGSVDSPNFEKKLKFLGALKNYLTSLNQNSLIIVGGDFNVAPFEMDVYSPDLMKNRLLYSLAERKAMRSILNAGFIDLYRIHNPKGHDFSWWDYRERAFANNAGLRIDFLFANPKLADLLSMAYIDIEPRKQTECSDHTPVVAKFVL